MTRKKCSQCGLVNFIADESCKRCGSDKLFKTLVSDNPVNGNLLNDSIDPAIKRKLISIGSYFLYFFLAVIVEFFALLPVLANIGFRHSARAPLTDFERKSQFWAFVLNIPSSIIYWILEEINEAFGILFLFIPITQVIFWIVCFVLLWKKVKKVYAALITLAFLVAFVLLSLSIFR